MSELARSNESATGWSSWRLILLLMSICFLAHFNRNCMPVAGDLRIMSEYGITPTQMGIVYSAFLAAYTLFMIPGGMLIDRSGPRVALQVVCFGSAVFVLLTGVVGFVAATSFLALPSFLVVRTIMGMLSAPLHPAAANAVALGVSRRQRSTANGLVTGAALLGIASSYVGFGWLIDRLTWPWAFVVAGVTTAAAGLIWSVLAPFRQLTESQVAQPTMPSSLEPSKVRSHLVRGNKNLWLVTISYAAVGYFQYLFFYWMHYYFKEVLKLGDEQSRWYAAIPPLAMAASMPLGGWLSDQIESKYGWRAARGGMAATAMVGSALLLLLGINSTDPVLLVMWMSLALGALGMLEGPFWATAVEVGGRQGGLSASIINTGGNAGGIVAPVITPWISSDLGYGWATGLGVGSVVCIVGAVMWYWIDDPSQTKAQINRDAPWLVPRP